jgi:hypothetical protein
MFEKQKIWLILIIIIGLLEITTIVTAKLSISYPEKIPINEITINKISDVLEGKQKYITWEEYQAIIKAYNQKLKQIKNNCQNDKRCLEKNGEKRIIFSNIKNKKEISQIMNKWLKEDNSIYAK